MISSEQIRAARALLGLSQAGLATLSGVHIQTVKRLELGKAEVASDRVIEAVRKALESAGVVFVPENGEGAGVRWKKGFPRDG